MTQVVYLSHPVGPSQYVDELMKRHDNLAVASSWLRYLVKKTRWAIVSPVIAFSASLDSHDSHSPRALTDQVMILERCDLVVQVGGLMSPHMVIERNHANRHGIPVVDLLIFGTYPPNDDDETAAEILERHVLDVALAKPRVPWLPPLVQEDVEKLRQAQVILANDPLGEDSVLLLQRIIGALQKIWPKQEE